MAENKKVYQIEIQGVKESISEIDALVSKLNDLDIRLDRLSEKTVKVSVDVPTVGGGGTTASRTGGATTSRTSALQTEDKLLKQIYATEQQINDIRREEYQSLLANKELLKEAKQDADEIAARERLVANAYSNTMAGMKQQLADIKKVMNTTDISDEGFQKMVAKASELNEKLKELEKSYGVFSRDVGHYENATKGLQEITVSVGGVERSFGSVREASRTLRNELYAMTLAGKEDTEAFGELSEAIHSFEMGLRRAESAMGDLRTSSKIMDDLLDTAESLTAIGQVSNGLSSLFGMDDSEIQRSIQRLVALQSVLNGIEKLRQQMNTQEGIGKILARGNSYIDSFIGKLVGTASAIKGVDMSSKSATYAVKGLSLALKGIGIGLLIAGFTAAVELLTNMAKGAYDFVTGAGRMRNAIESLDSSLNSLNRTYQIRNDLNSAAFLKGQIDSNQFLAEQYKIQNEHLQKQIELLRDRTSLANTTSWWERNVQGKQRGEFNAQEFSGEYKVNPYDDWISFYPLVVKSIQEIEDEWEKHNEAIKKNEDYYSEYGSTIMDYMRSIVVSVDDTKEAMRGLGNVRLSDFISEIAKANDEFANGEINATIYARKLKDLVAQMNDSKVLNSVIANLDKYIPDEKVREQVNNIINELIRLDDAFNMTSAQQVHYWNQVRIDGMKEGWAKQKAQIDESERYEIEQHGKTQEQIDLIQRKYDQQREKARKSFNDKAKNDAEKHKKDLIDAEKELNSLIIANMNEGLDKQLALLRQEYNEKVKAARKRGKKVGEIEAELNKQYEKKILDAKKKWAYDMQKAYTDMWNNIYNINHTWQTRTLETQLQEYEKYVERQKELARELIDTNSVAYGSMGTQTQAQNMLRADTSVKNVDGIQDAEAKQYLALMETVRKARVDLDEALRDSDEAMVASRKKAFDKALEDVTNYVEQMGRSFDEYDESVAVQQLIDENYTTDLTVQFELRLKSNQNYYKEIEKLSTDYVDKVIETEAKKLELNYNEQLRVLRDSYTEQNKVMEENLEKGLITQEQYNEAKIRLEEERTKNEYTIGEKYYSDVEKLAYSRTKQVQDINAVFHTNTINDLRDFYSRMTAEDTSYIMNPMGFLNTTATRKRNNELIRHYSNLVDQISIEMDRLREEFSANKITFEVFEQAKRELTSLKTSVESSVETIIEDNKNLFNDSMTQIAGMVSQFGQTLSSLISSIGDYQDQQYQNQIDQLEEFIDKYDEKLSELDDVISEHTSNVNSIESELSKARGDRRQALIDQLNAEKLAQREALANQKKMEKEKEALEKKKEAVEKERNKKQQQISLTTAIINGSVAFTNALATQPIWLGIALAAMTAAMTAVQVATIKSQKYADGGVLQGKSHAQGGIKVLGGTAEVEGKEFITNKVTTQKNVELLYYINSKKKKLSLEDFIDFYSDGKKVSTNVKSIGNKYASGGQLPQIRTDVNINDRLLEAFEAYSNRNVVVSVTDIIDRMSDVRDVQVLAGLNPDY